VITLFPRPELSEPLSKAFMVACVNGVEGKVMKEELRKGGFRLLAFSDWWNFPGKRSSPGYKLPGIFDTISFRRLWIDSLSDYVYFCSYQTNWRFHDTLVLEIYNRLSEYGFSPSIPHSLRTPEGPDLSLLYVDVELETGFKHSDLALRRRIRHAKSQNRSVLVVCLGRRDKQRYAASGAQWVVHLAGLSAWCAQHRYLAGSANSPANYRLGNLRKD